MKHRSRIYYTEQQKTLMRERWHKGDSLQQIAQLFDRNHSAVGQILSETGRIEPRQRHRSSTGRTRGDSPWCRARAGPCDRLPHHSSVRHPPSAMKFVVTGVAGPTGPRKLTRWPGIGRTAPMSALVQNRDVACLVAKRLQA